MKILVLNSGSSSVKYGLYDWEKDMPMSSGVVERVGLEGSFIKHSRTGEPKVKLDHDCPTHKEAIELIVDTLVHEEHGLISDMSEISAVGHRMVHGGEKFAKSVVIDDTNMATFKELIDLAPLHNPPNIMGVEAAQKILPNVKHCAIMDTAWHQTMPKKSYTYALPHEWYEKFGVRRYGFHGTSFLYNTKRAAVLLGQDPFETNLIIAHIGNGASINAVKNGVSYDTSMGLTPLEGLVMGTRCGDIDPAIPLFIMDKEGLDSAELTKLLNKKSGCLGVAGHSDRRDILEAHHSGDKNATLALEIETQRLKKYIGSYTAILGRVDALVFTAGVGEFSDEIRAMILDGLEPLGLKYDKVANHLAGTRNAEVVISTPDSPVKIFVIPTDEERVFIEDVVALDNGTYDIHTNFTYKFQSPDYRNIIREHELEQELKENPDLAKIIVKIPGK